MNGFGQTQLILCVKFIMSSCQSDQTEQISNWVVGPYKAPERNEPNNEVFNNHISMLQIWSEHAIGFLKGHFHSLKNLRIHIRNKASHIFATYWIAACIGVHAFVMKHEAEEQMELDLDHSDIDAALDPFVGEGMVSDSERDEENVVGYAGSNLTGHGRLQEGKAKQEQLKRRLFHAKRLCTEQREHDQMEALGILDSSDSDTDST